MDLRLSVSGALWGVRQMFSPQEHQCNHSTPIDISCPDCSVELLLTPRQPPELAAEQEQIHPTFKPKTDGGIGLSEF